MQRQLRPGHPRRGGHERLRFNTHVKHQTPVKCKCDAELSNTTCVVVRGAGLVDVTESIRRQDLPQDKPLEGRHLVVATLGDCRVLLGRREVGKRGQPLQWRTVRFTHDHKSGHPAEATQRSPFQLVYLPARVRVVLKLDLSNFSRVRIS